MLDHFSHAELACPTTDQVRLAAGFGEALEGVCAVLESPWQLIEQTQGFRLTVEPPHSNIGNPSIGDRLLGVSAMPVILTLIYNPRNVPSLYPVFSYLLEKLPFLK